MLRNNKGPDQPAGFLILLREILSIPHILLRLQISLEFEFDIVTEPEIIPSYLLIAPIRSNKSIVTCLVKVANSPKLDDLPIPSHYNVEPGELSGQ